MSIDNFIFDLSEGINFAATKGISELAQAEAIDSNLYGCSNDGPGDAYRHLLLAAGLTATFGEGYANTLLQGHELQNLAVGGSQESYEMDTFNNDLGIAIGNDIANSGGNWEDLVKKCKEKIEETRLGGEGATWINEGEWPDAWDVDSAPYYEVPKDNLLTSIIDDCIGNVVAPFINNIYNIGKLFGYSAFEIKTLIAETSSLNSKFSNTVKAVTEKEFLARTNASPLVVDLDGDGVETISKEDGVYFDHDKNGFAEKSGWAGADDGILVRDINNNGQIDDGSELFGNNTILSNGAKALNGFI
jgi:hypothetical protein